MRPLSLRLSALCLSAAIGSGLWSLAGVESPRESLSSAGAPASHGQAGTPAGLSPDARQRALDTVSRVPMHFERNEGQAAGPFGFVARGAGYSVGLTPAEATVMLTTADEAEGQGEASSTTFAFRLRGGRADAQPAPGDRLPGVVNYLKGNDPSRWQQGVPTFARVRYAEVYDGIDVVYYGNQKRLQYDFIVAPGGDVAQIALDVRGAERVAIDADGNLELTAGGRTLEQEKPYTYQVADNGERREVPSRFVLDGETVRFDVGDYDATRELVIDPVIAYSSWFGASGEEGVLDLAVDTDGGIVIYGYSHDLEGTLKFPVTAGAVKTSRGSDTDGFVTKFNAAGSAIVFSTLIGGSDYDNFSRAYIGGLALDASSNVYVTGTTQSNDFPTTPGAFDTTRNDVIAGRDDGFYAKLSPTGGLLYGTYLGGRGIDVPWGLDIDGAGNVYIVGKTGSLVGNDPDYGGFTITGNAYDSTFNGTNDAFLMRFTSAGVVDYATYIGGSGADAYYGADVKASRTTANVVYMVMDAGNSSFPTQGTALAFGGGYDAAVIRLNLALSGTAQMTYGSFFGGTSSDEGHGIALDSTDGVYIVGNTFGNNFASLPSAPGSPAPSGWDVFVAKFNTSVSGAASLVYRLRLNGFYSDYAYDIAVDSLNQAWFTVASGSLAPTPNLAQDFPLKNTLSTTRSGNYQHAVVVQVNAAGNDLVMSSLIGGDSGTANQVAVAINNTTGDVWVGGSSGGGDSALGRVAAYDMTYNGGDTDVTVQRIGKQADLSITKTVDKPYPTVTVLPGETMTYTITVNNPGDPVSNLVVTDNLPSQVSFVSCAATLSGVCAGAGSNRTITFPSIGTGQSGVVTLVVRVNDNVGPGVVWTNTASYTAGGVVDPNSGNNTGGGGGSNGNGGGGVPVITNPSGDADADGLPNGWEQQYGLNPLSNSPANGASGDPDADGKTNAQEFNEGTHPRGFVITYLAEGATGAFFDTRLAIANPSALPALVLTRFQKSDGTTIRDYRTIPAMSRATIDVKTVAGLEAAEFATLVEADVQVVVDRTLSWNNQGYGSHAERGILTRTATEWYFAEGATHSGFALFYLIQNPNTTDAIVEVRYLRPPPAAALTKTYTVRAQSRFNIWVNDEAVTDPNLASLAATDVSVVMRSTNAVPIIAERALYKDLPGQTFGIGHESAGVTAPSTSWFLAEGATGSFMDMFVLLANPNNTAAQVTVDYLLPGGQLSKSYTVDANSRYNIWVDLEEFPDGSGNRALADTAVSATVTSTNGIPIIVERSMYWPGPSFADWKEAHNSPGSTVTGTRWAVAEGETGGARSTETYVLVANTSAFAGQVKATVLFEDGSPAVEKTFPALAAKSRFNIVPAADFPTTAGKRFGMIVESIGGSPIQIVVERAMYSNAGGVIWAAGTNALATRLQ